MRIERRVVWAIAGALGVVVVVVAVVVVAGLATTRIAGSPVASGGSDSPRISVPQLPDGQTTPGDATGWAEQPFDQPAPVPGFNWQGWASQPNGRCEWLPQDLLAPLAKGPARLGGHFCHVPLAGGDYLQIKWGGTYSALLYDPVAFSYPLTVAGLEARVYDLAANQEVYPGSCQVEVNTRSLASFVVLNWNPERKPADREARCAVATRAAELIAKRMVPAAGGTVWRPTPQRPSPAAAGGKDACKIVDDLVTTYVGVESVTPTQQRNELGDNCRYERNGKEIVALVTDGPAQGLDQVAPPEQADVTSRKLGVLPAREEAIGRTCALAVEFLPGRLLRTQYSDDSGQDIACEAAEVLAGQAIVQLLEDTAR